MVELSGGVQLLANGATREQTTIQVTFQGQVFEGDISADMRRRFVDGDPYMRSILEYGEVEHETDKDGNDAKSFVPKGIDGSAIVSTNDPDTIVRAQQAEKKAAKLQVAADELALKAAGDKDEIAALTAQVADLEDALKEAGSSSGSTLSLDDLSSEALAAEAEKRGVEVVGSGSTGNVLKKDLVRALEEARASH